MKESEISKLLQRYLKAEEEGVEPYFDVDEIDCLLDNFEETETYTHYKGVLTLGMKLYPLNTEFKVRECKYHLFMENYDKASSLANSLGLTNNPDLDLVRLECFCEKNQYKEIIRYVKDLTDNQCGYLQDIYESVSQMLCDYDMVEEAEDFIKRGLSLFPKSYILRDEICFIMETEGEYERAIKLCSELIDENPYSYDLWYLLGRLYSMTANYEKAIEAFDFALTCDDSDSELKILKAYCLFMNENYLKAIDLYNEIVTDKEIGNRINSLLASCYIKLDDFEKAYELLKDIIVQETESIDATTLVNFIHCCMKTDHEQEAFQMLLKAVNLFPENIRVLALLALSYLDRGNEEMALTITNRIIKQLDIISQEHDFLDTSPLTKQEKYIPIKDLTKEYLSNRDNNN